MEKIESKIGGLAFVQEINPFTDEDDLTHDIRMGKDEWDLEYERGTDHVASYGVKITKKKNAVDIKISYGTDRYPILPYDNWGDVDYVLMDKLLKRIPKYDCQMFYLDTPYARAFLECDIEKTILAPRASAKNIADEIMDAVGIMDDEIWGSWTEIRDAEFGEVIRSFPPK